MPEDEPVRSNAFGCITVPFLLIALIPLMWGARGSWQNGELARDGEIVPGRVIDLQYVPSNPSVRTSRTSAVSPTVSYTTRQGEARTVTGSVNRGPAPWSVGDTVDVTYDPSNPARADVSSELDNWRLWFAIWCLVAALPTAIALAPVVMLMRQRRARRPSDA
jgi:hypothetical protein